MDSLKKFFNDVFSFETIKYVAAGSLAGGTNFCLYFILKDFFGVNYLLSNFVSWVSGVTISFFLNSRYVFKSKDSQSKKLAGFFLSRGISCAADMLLLYFLVDILSISSGIGKILDSAVISVANYLVSKFIIFKS